MKLHTTSATIRFAKELEEQSAQFYEDLSRIYPEGQGLWLALAQDNRNYASQIQQAYYSVITDAIEGGYAFDLESEEYALKLELQEGAGYTDVVNKALTAEEAIFRFYMVAAEQSQSLMADIPRNFRLVAKKRRARIEKLTSCS